MKAWRVRFREPFNGCSEFIFEPYEECLIPGKATRPQDYGLQCRCVDPISDVYEHVSVDLDHDQGWDDILMLLAHWYPDADDIEVIA